MSLIKRVSYIDPPGELFLTEIVLANKDKALSNESKARAALLRGLELVEERGLIKQKARKARIIDRAVKKHFKNLGQATDSTEIKFEADETLELAIQAATDSSLLDGRFKVLTEAIVEVLIEAGAFDPKEFDAEI